MIIERNDKEIVLRVSKDLDIEDLQRMVEWIDYKEVSKKSKATQKEVDELVKAVKKNRWKKTRGKLGL
ncbi:MAG: hypothetical protein AAF363_16785 [Bacteroidota bacterium]